MCGDDRFYCWPLSKEKGDFYIDQEEHKNINKNRKNILKGLFVKLMTRVWVARAFLPIKKSSNFQQP